MLSPETGLTHAAWVSIRKQSVNDAERRKAGRPKQTMSGKGVTLGER